VNENQKEPRNKLEYPNPVVVEEIQR